MMFFAFRFPFAFDCCCVPSSAASNLEPDEVAAAELDAYGS